MGEVVIPGIEVSDFAFIPSLLPVGLVRGKTIAEAQFNAVLMCWRHGMRARTPKHVEGETPLGYDANITVVIEDPFAEPRIFTPGWCMDEFEVVKYQLEVIYGISDDRVGKDWDYSYHERYSRHQQVQRLLRKIVSDWQTKGRISGRDYQLSLWDPITDLERDDPPCWQILNLRFREIDGQYWAVMQELFRSRDEMRAWWSNVDASSEFFRLFCLCLSQKIGFEIKPGPIIDQSFSLHIYGNLLTGDKNLRTTLFPRMLAEPWQTFAMSTATIFPPGERERILRLIAAQLDYKDKTGIFGAKEEQLKSHYDLATFPYDPQWDSYPKEWDKPIVE
jgi:thymidylate synthase